jgi:hypothetical protein
VKKFLLLLLTACFLSGCMTTGVRVTAEQLAGLKEGVATEVDVTKVLGKPQSTSTSSDGTRMLVFAYMNYQVNGATFIPVVGLVAGGSTMDTSTTVFTFGKDGKMISYNVTESQHQSRNGGVGTSTPDTKPH